VLPYSDLDLREFLAGVPPRQFSLGGLDRSLFRRAMIGVLPEEIRTRTDKHAYVPDFAHRLIAERPRLLDWLACHRSERWGESTLADYLDLDRIETALNQLQPVTGRAAWDNRVMGIACVGPIGATFLIWLARQGGTRYG
jgi:asparagine synthase (glutamine-hydrolysing)